MVGKTQRRVAAELIGDLERVYRRSKEANKELKELVASTGTTLMDLHGIGPSGAARLLVEVGDVTRFPNRAHFASWNGTAPITPASSGNHAEIASTVTGPAGPIFVKAASGELSVRSLRYELAATQAIDRHPPAVLWQFESDGWLVVGTEHLPGPHPDLSPGSTDLNLLLAALTALQETPAPGETWFTPAARLEFAHPAMDGETLIHSDLNPANLIVTPLGLRIVDWAWATKAAAWVELALLVPWLIGSGHTAEQAE
ncbi:transposase [Micromonospora sp. LH3U1]|uniref:transposase n=1 Tax=Micromonospora sp. LH3U1 TaxID=3018339 RepID=UPI00300E4B81